jgi:hypothetical protein
MRNLLVIALAVLIAACSSSDGDAAKKRRQPSPSASGWYFSYGKNEPVIAADASFVWTASPYVEIDYMLKGWGDLDPAKSIAVTYRIDTVSGTPVLQSTECTATQNKAAKAALIIRNSTNNSDYYNRAWWTQTAPMTIGTHTITAPLGDGAGWTFVAGDSSPTKYPGKWSYMLNNIRDIGLTFNGCSSMGHGAYVTGGTAKFTIVSVTVQ